MVRSGCYCAEGALQADMAPATTITEVDNSRVRAGREEDIRIVREQLVRGIPKAKDREVLQTLEQQLDGGTVEIKVHTRRPTPTGYPVTKVI